MRVQPEKLGEMAEMFANRIPEEVVSPVGIQGFLLARKNDPEGAPREVRNRRSGEMSRLSQGNKPTRKKE
jgi:chaperone BCS1